MAYDAATGNAVLFSGYSGNKKYVVYHGTWTWGDFEPQAAPRQLLIRVHAPGPPS